MDKTIVVGTDGKARFELTPDNQIIDLRDFCICDDPDRPTERDGEQTKCLICNLLIQNP